ncbi:DUF551 domain-containing protein [Raoultella planticola]
MTKSTITRGRLEKIKSWRETYGAGSNVMLPAEEAEKLALIALAAMDSEPVKRVNADQMHRVCLESNRHLDKYVAMAKEVNKLLGRTPAQPAPVVPAVSDDIGEIRVGRLPTMNQDDYPGLGDWWVQLRIGEDSDEVLARVYGATPQEANNRAEALACRAATLQAGNSPVIPEWIPVSEQMPEDRTQVILWDAEIGEVTSGHYSHKTHTFYHCGDAIENEITHWMPPPCAPQEVNRE